MNSIYITPIHTGLRAIPHQMAASYFPSWFLSYGEDMRVYKGLRHWLVGVLKETGYFHLNATRPDTPGRSYLTKTLQCDI